MNRLFSGRSDMPFALLLLAPSLLLLGGLVAWPMVSNIEISFLRLPLNPNIESTFVGVSNNAVCYDPAQFAMSGVRDANVRVGDFVVVVGLGAIGQIAIQLAKRAGASVVIGVDPIAHRCDIARRHGADFCLNPIGTDVGKEIKTLTGKQGADVIIETSGYADALQSAFRGLAYGVTISYVAFAKPLAEGFNLGREAHFNNAKIVFSRACSEPNPDYPRWSRKRIEETCWELLMNGYLNCEDLIDPVVTFANSPESYMQYVDQHPEQSIKMGVTF
ncbi:zinc-dependent alcohol dehydrogenase [Escherichia coli]|uniref:zinc-dependent alcohol dehydrogenase n=1 Tax=Escherichia coli TaxID=562 RepID=UPI00098BEADA|nr:zinc-binding alcohol dehydrogenase [Escherichia coli]MDI1000544.1 zinc-binding alcohol dehydrogenase [Escherichia coli]